MCSRSVERAWTGGSPAYPSRPYVMNPIAALRHQNPPLGLPFPTQHIPTSPQTLNLTTQIYRHDASHLQHEAVSRADGVADSDPAAAVFVNKGWALLWKDQSWSVILRIRSARVAYLVIFACDITSGGGACYE
jgi:hypothetical protein